MPSRAAVPVLYLKALVIPPTKRKDIQTGCVQKVLPPKKRIVDGKEKQKFRVRFFKFKLIRIFVQW